MGLIAGRAHGGSNTLFVTLAALSVAFVLLWPAPAAAQGEEEPTAELSIVKKGPESVEPGEEFDYTLTVSNAAGAGTAEPVVVTDLLPPGVRFEYFDASAGVTCGPPDDGPDGRDDVTCTVPTLEAGESQTITLIVTAPAEPGEITNRATADSPTDTGPEPDATSEPVITRVAPELVIEKLDTPDPVEAEARLVYTLRVENTGSTPAKGVRIRDELPIEDLNFIDIESRAFDCRYSAGIVRCTGGRIGPGDFGTVRIIAEPETAGTIENTGEVFVPGIPEALDADTEETVVRPASGPAPGPTPGPNPAPGPGPTPGEGCSTVVDTDTEEPVGVLTGTRDLFFTYTNDAAEEAPLRIVYATSSEDGTLTVRVTPEGENGAILEEKIEGARRGVLTVPTEANTTYDVEVLPEDQGYAVLFEVGEGDRECTDPESLEPPEVASSDDPDDDVVDEVDNEEGTLADTGGLPLSGVIPAAAALLLVAGLLTVRGLTRR